MRLSIRAMVIAGAVLWGGGMLLVGLMNLADPNNGVSFLQMTNSVYPLFHMTHNWSVLLVRTLEGALDGAIAAAIFAALYNSIAAHGGISAMSQR